MQKLEKVLETYGVKGKIAAIHEGPLVRQIEFQPETGTKIKSITAVLDDVAREIGVSSLRVEPIEGSSNIGFEVPADEMKTVDFASVLEKDEFKSAKGALPLCLGVDIRGVPVIADLAKMPHLLVAGTTGSGKSVGLNTFILSLIKKRKPADLKFVLIDPKRIEFSIYNHLKYLLLPVVTEMSQASSVLAYLVEEMERRYSLFEESMTKNIAEYNEEAGHLPYIVCVVDEFADLMAYDKSVDKSIQRLAQKARAAGIHIILATQRPSVDVVTGVLKANFPTRLSYKVASSADSRTILDVSGAEKLLGRGDALFLSATGDLKRVHGAYMPDKEIAEMLEPWRGEVKAPKLPEKNLPQKENVSVSEKKGKGFFRTIWDFWVSLRQKDKKVIVAAIMYFINLVVGSRKKRR